MRDPIENVSLLQKQLNTLQLENQILKNILDRSGVSYMQELKHLREPEGTESFDLNQGKGGNRSCPLIKASFSCNQFIINRCRTVRFVCGCCMI